MSWFSQLASSEGATAFSGFIKNLEDKIDKVLEIPPSGQGPPAASSTNSQGTVQKESAAASETPALQALSGLSASLSSGFATATSSLSKAAAVTPSSKGNGGTQEDFFSSMFGSIGGADAFPMMQSPASSPVRNLRTAKSEAPSPAASSPLNPAPKTAIDSTAATDSEASKAPMIMPPDIPIHMLSEKLDSKANEKERAVQGSDPNPSTTIIPPEENKETLLQAETETDVEPSSEEAPNGEANSAKSTDLQSVIEQREAQLMKMMHQNAELNDSLSKIGKEKADMQQKMDSLEAEVRNMAPVPAASNGQIDLLTAELQRKNEQIESLVHEGEALSKKELKSNQLIKKLKLKETELEKTNQDLTKKLDLTSAELLGLKEQLGKMADLEKRHKETIRNLSSLNEEQNRQFKQLEADLHQASDQLNALKFKYDGTSKELQELRTLDGDRSLAAQSEQLEAEKKAYSELNEQFEAYKAQMTVSGNALKKELVEVRGALQRSEEESGWKEDQYRKEISMLNSRLQSADARQEDLAMLGQEATKPLLRQIDALQNQYNSAIIEWEKLEKSLTLRIRDSEASKLEIVKNEETLKEEILSMSIRLKDLESKLESQKVDKAKLSQEVSNLKLAIEEKDDQVRQLKVEYANRETKHQQDLEKLTTVLDIKHQKALEHERRVCMDEKEKEISRVKTETQKLIRASSSQLSASSEELASAPAQQMSSRSSSVAIDRLQQTMKQQEGQVKSLQAQLDLTIKIRDEMAQELFKVSTELEDHRSRSNDFETLSKGKKEAEDRYSACLELLGEKEERIVELSTDIQEMKEVFHSQVQELCAKINALTAKPGHS